MKKKEGTKKATAKNAFPKKPVTKTAEKPVEKKADVVEDASTPKVENLDKKPALNAPVSPAKAKAKKAKSATQEAKKEAPENPLEESSIPKEDLAIRPVPDACDEVADGFTKKMKVGFFDGNSKFCKDCGEEYPEAQAACKHNTEVEAKLATKKPVKAKGGARAPRTGLSVLGNGGGAGKVDELILRPEGATMEELLACRGAVTSHLARLKTLGVKIEKRDGRYYATAPA